MIWLIMNERLRLNVLLKRSRQRTPRRRKELKREAWRIQIRKRKNKKENQLLQ